MTQGLLPSEGARVQVTVGGPGVREIMGSSSTNWLEAGQCRAMYLLQEGPMWKSSGSIPVPQPPRGRRMPSHPAEPWAQSTAPGA